ncbi:hypothetical protein [Nocardia sp. NPDC020380]|uniref:hypothetical protein n=1 Tax=Nocardia sp. NPDC020380 TaxID=3364309 RepID=UPI0037BD3771
MRWLAVLAEFLFVAAVAYASVWCWRNGIHTSWFQASGDAPGFGARRYSGPWLAGAAVLMAAAGVVLIDGVVRAVRFAR